MLFFSIYDEKKNDEVIAEKKPFQNSAVTRRFGRLELTLVVNTSSSYQWLKWFCEAGGGSPDKARMEQTPYPFQPH